MTHIQIIKTAIIFMLGLGSVSAYSQQLKPKFGRYAIPFPNMTNDTAEALVNDSLKLEIEKQKEYKAALESQCGGQDDSQFVEAYNGIFADGGFSPKISFVMEHQSSTGQIQWNSDLVAKYPSPGNPGNVTNARWCSGTLIADDLFLTAGHCFNRSGGGWIRPTKVSNGQVVGILEPEIAQNMHVNFNYQFKDNTNVMREEVEFPIVELIENWKNNLDYAIVRLGRNSNGKTAGSLFGIRKIASVAPTAGLPITIIQHPNGNPKKVEAGSIKLKTATLIHYGDLDTFSGASGSAVLNKNGEIIGVHVEGGCTEIGFGTNKATSIEAIRQVSGIIQ